MAKKPDYSLYQFIQTLEKDEIALVRKSFKRSKKGGLSKYEQLFNLAIKQNIDNEKLVISDGISESKKELSDTKRYLWKRIMGVLATESPSEDAKVTCYRLIADAQLLLNRGIEKRAITLLNKTITIAQNAEFFEVLITAGKLKHSIATISKSENKRLRDLIAKSVSDFNNHLNYRDLYHKLYDIYERVGRFNSSKRANKAYQQIIDNPIMKTVRLAKSNQAKFRFYRIKELIAFVRYETNKTLYYCKKATATYEKFAAYSELNRFQYLLLLCDVYITEVEIDPKSCKATFQKIKALKFTNSKYNIKKDTICFYCKTCLHLENEAYGRLIDLGSEMELFLKRNAKRIDQFYLNFIAQNLGRAYFNSKNFNTAHYWFSLPLQQTEMITSFNAFLLELFVIICLFEQNDNKVAVQFCRKLYKKQKQAENSDSCAVIKIVKSLITNKFDFTDEADKSELLLVLKLNKHGKDFIEIYNWITQKITGHNFEEFKRNYFIN